MSDVGQKFGTAFRSYQNENPHLSSSLLKGRVRPGTRALLPDKIKLGFRVTAETCASPRR